MSFCIRDSCQEAKPAGGWMCRRPHYCCVFCIFHCFFKCQITENMVILNASVCNVKTLHSAVWRTFYGVGRALCVFVCVRTVLLVGLFLEARSVSWVRSRLFQDKHEFPPFIIYEWWLPSAKFSALCVCFLSNASSLFIELFSVGISPDGSDPHSMLYLCVVIKRCQAHPVSWLCWSVRFIWIWEMGKHQKLLLLCPTHTGCPVPGQAVTCAKGRTGGLSNVLCSAGRGCPWMSHIMNNGFFFIWVPSLTPSRTGSCLHPPADLSGSPRSVWVNEMRLFYLFPSANPKFTSWGLVGHIEVSSGFGRECACCYFCS